MEARRKYVGQHSYAVKQDLFINFLCCSSSVPATTSSLLVISLELSIVHDLLSLAWFHMHKIRGAKNSKKSSINLTEELPQDFPGTNKHVVERSTVLGSEP